MIKEENGVLVIRTPYNADFKSEIKEAGAVWHGGEAKHWTMPVSKREDAERIVARYFSEYTPERKQAAEHTVERKVQDIVHDKSSLYNGDTVERLVAFAYHYGRESMAKELSDQYRSMILDMRKKAEQSRYSTMISEIIGDKNFIYLEEYARKITKTIGPLETEL